MYKRQAQAIVITERDKVAMFIPPGTSCIAPSGNHSLPQALASARIEKYIANSPAKNITTVMLPRTAPVTSVLGRDSDGGKAVLDIMFLPFQLHPVMVFQIQLSMFRLSIQEYGLSMDPFQKPDRF